MDYTVKNDLKHKNKVENKGRKLVIEIFKKNIVLFFITVVVMVITTFLGIIGPIIIKQAIDIDIAIRDYNGLVKRVLQFLAVNISISLFTGFYIYLTELFGQNFLFDLKSGIFKHITRLPVKFFDRTPVGKIMARIESDGESVRQFFTRTVISLITDVLMFVGMIFVMFKYSKVLTLIVLMILPVIIFISYLYQKSVSPIWVKIRKIYSELMGSISDSIKAHKVIKVFNASGWIAKKINSYNKKIYSENIKGETFSIFYYNSMLIFEAIALSLIIWYGGVKTLKGGLTVGTLVLFITYVRQFFGPVKNLSSQFQLIQKANASLIRINGILSEETEENNFNKEQKIDIKSFNKSIIFKDVYFGSRIIFDGTLDKSFGSKKEIHIEAGVNRNRAIARATGPAGTREAELKSLEYLVGAALFNLPRFYLALNILI